MYPLFLSQGVSRCYAQRKKNVRKFWREIYWCKGSKLSVRIVAKARQSLNVSGYIVIDCECYSVFCSSEACTTPLSDSVSSLMRDRYSPDSLFTARLFSKDRTSGVTPPLARLVKASSAARFTLVPRALPCFPPRKGPHADYAHLGRQVRFGYCLAKCVAHTTRPWLCCIITLRCWFNMNCLLRMKTQFDQKRQSRKISS